MESFDSNQNEPLIEGMTELPEEGFSVPAAPASLKSSLWERTAREVRLRPRRRRLAVAGGLVGAYLAGCLTVMGAWETLQQPDSPEASRSENAQPAPPRGPSDTDPLLATLLRDPGHMEQQLASAPMPERRRLLKRAGDLYLSEGLNVEGALTYYQQLLDGEDGSTQGSIPSGESWLLSALRHARELEVNREKSNG